MPALIPTNFVGTVTWMGQVRDRKSSLIAAPVDVLDARFAGVDGEDHSGLTRASCNRVTSQYSTGTTIRNVRQLSIVSAEEMEQIAANMQIEQVDPAWLGATIVIRGIPDFTHVPPASRLQAPSGATLTIDMENRPCQLPARVIEQALPGRGKTFKSAAAGLRGVTAWVECEGELLLGDSLTLHVPDQREWDPN